MKSPVVWIPLGSFGLFVTLFLFIISGIDKRCTALDTEVDTLQKIVAEEITERKLLAQKTDFNMEKILSILIQKFPKEAERADTIVKNNNRIKSDTITKIDTVFVYDTLNIYRTDNLSE